jgi:hypothetical protein
VAFLIYRLLANGMGGVNWEGLPLWCGYLGVQDVDGLMQRLVAIRMHAPKKEG